MPKLWTTPMVFCRRFFGGPLGGSGNGIKRVEGDGHFILLVDGGFIMKVS